MALQTWVVLAVLVAIGAPVAPADTVRHPVYPSDISSEEAQTMAAELVRYVNMPEAALRSLVPKQSGLYFCGCPNCEGGTQEGNMEWSPGDPEHVHCKSCGHVYPSPDYPMTHEVRVKSPRGEEHVYRYHQDPRGRQYFFEARIWYAKIHYYDGVALRLAQVYDATRDERYAQAAAVLLDQYARVVPGYVPKFDYPFRAKQFFGAEAKPPYPVTPYRASRYSWWAYMDVPDELVLAYDLIASSTALDSEMRARIERDLIRGSVDWVLLNPEQLTNMAPGVWQSMVQAGRIVGEPDYIHDAVERARRFLREQFFYDHFWREGSPSYHLQSVEYLQSALDMMKGYSDPAGYVSPRDGQQFQNLDPDSLFPELPKARAVAELMRLPDGRYAPVHDTWWTHKGEPLQKSEPHLLPAMGYAILGSGTGKDQVQVHLASSGGYGHEHMDNLAMLLWANGREVFSDLGYTHTKDRAWTICSAGHNTVLIDQRDQHAGAGTDGNLLLWGKGHLSSVVEADGRAACPQASVYRRLLALVERPGGLPFAVDIFRVSGGEVHDWFLHGNADEDTELQFGLVMQPFGGSLIPVGFTFLPPENEGDFRMFSDAASPGLYGYLRDLREAPADGAWHADFVSPDGATSRLIMVGAPGTEVFSGRDPSVRRARDDDSKLAQFTRPFVMARRKAAGKQSVFAAVLDPAAGQAGRAVTEVTPLLVDDQAVVLHITSPASTYLVATCIDPARQVTCESPEGQVVFQGRYALLRRGGRSVAAESLGASKIAWGSASFAGAGRLEGRVLSVSADALEITANAADVADPANQMVIITHGDGTSHGYQIARAERSGPDSAKLFLAATGFEYDPERKLTRFTSFPLSEIAGENRFSIDLIREDEHAMR
jgi:hypothetical protein